MTGSEEIDYRFGAITVAGFGAALSVLTVAPDVNAAVTPLTVTPATVPYAGYAGYVDVIGADFTGQLYVFNDPTGQTLGTAPGIYGFRLADYGDRISAGQSFYFGPYLSPGTQTFAFLTDDSRVGWIQIQFAAVGDPITFADAAFNAHGGAILAGTQVVPVPAALPLMATAVLALGAAGVRETRRRRAERARAED